MATCKFRKSKFISTKNNRKYRSRNQVGGGRGRNPRLVLLLRRRGHRTRPSTVESRRIIERWSCNA